MEDSVGEATYCLTDYTVALPDGLKVRSPDRYALPSGSACLKEGRRTLSEARQRCPELFSEHHPRRIQTAARWHRSHTVSGDWRNGGWTPYHGPESAMSSVWPVNLGNGLQIDTIYIALDSLHC